LYRQIAEQLRQLMVSGEFGLGSRLPAERDLAVQLGVSRPSVREALIALEVEGMIEVRTGSGIYVRQNTGTKSTASTAELDDNTPANWGPLEVMSARILVEAEVAALAAANAQKGDLKAIKSGLQQMKLEAARDEVPRQGDEAFHEAIAQACGNSAARHGAALLDGP
jgi:DNA-binding FadR family transcriptional regulator